MAERAVIETHGPPMTRGMIPGAIDVDIHGNTTFRFSTHAQTERSEPSMTTGTEALDPAFCALQHKMAACGHSST
jgi:hypothetical protein